MRNGEWRGWVAAGCLALAGCAAQPAAVAPAQAVSALRTGLPLLACREACLAAWRQAQPQAARLDRAGRWADLAALVERVGYQDDLSLYYLGRAAEGLGYPGAAASYYRQSTYVSGTTISCLALSHLCGGLALPLAARLRLAAIERELLRRYPPRPGPQRRERGREEAVAPALPEAAAPPPPKAVAPLPSEAMPPPPRLPASPPPSEFIEPPPVLR